MSSERTPSTAADQRTLLNVGCGPRASAGLPSWFATPEWREVRLDINPQVDPDIVASITDMRGKVPDGFADAIWSGHNLEHLFAHEVHLALCEFARVIRSDGLVVIATPDLQRVAELVAEDRLEEPAYMSPAGPIAPLDMIYGYRLPIEGGNHFMAHKTGFTATSLRNALGRAGFTHGDVRRMGFDLFAFAGKAELSGIRLPAGITLSPPPGP